jgi:hypothetical protein
MRTAEFILLIFNCKKYKFKALKQRTTWLHNFTLIPYYHVIGDPNLDTDYLFDETDKILYVKTKDDYISLPKKVISAYEAINKEFIFKYIFKTDDDQHLTNNKFFNIIINLLLTKQPTIHYGGHIVNVEKSHYSDYYKIHPELPKNIIVSETIYCSGRFYILSDLAVHYLLTKKQQIWNEYFEDYAIGYYLNPILKHSILKIPTNKYFVDNIFT